MYRAVRFLPPFLLTTFYDQAKTVVGTFHFANISHCKSAKFVCPCSQQLYKNMHFSLR